jgi:hypothetical protein
MNKDEISKELGDFLKFNASDIRDLVKLSPDLANAFSNVILAIDEQYGAGTIVNQNTQNANSISNGNVKKLTKFLPGDYLNDVNKIDIPFKILYRDGKMEEEETILGKNFLAFLDTLIITSINELEGKLYYNTFYAKNVDYYNDEIVSDDEDYSMIFEVDALDDFYSNYYQMYGQPTYRIGSYVSFNRIGATELSELAKKRTIEQVTYNNNIKYITTIHTPSTFFTQAQDTFLFVKNVLNIDGINYYIFNDSIFFKGFLMFAANEFDACFKDYTNSIKNNTVFKIIDNVTNVYQWVTKIKFSIHVGTPVLSFKSIIFDDINSQFNPSYKININSQELYQDFFSNIAKNDRTQLSSNYYSKDFAREAIAIYEENNPIINVVKSGNTNNTFVPVKRPDYMKRALFNLSNTARKGPTSSATDFEEGTIMIGCDGGTWVVALDKNGAHRWKNLWNVFKSLPDEVFGNNNAVKTTTDYLSLSVLKEVEKNLWDGLQYFDVTDVEYTEINNTLFAVREFIQYYPNVMD